MGKRVDFSAAIFHEASGCVAAAGVSWFTLSKETSPLIVLIHHLTTGTHGDHKTSIAFFPSSPRQRVEPTLTRAHTHKKAAHHLLLFLLTNINELN